MEESELKTINRSGIRRLSDFSGSETGIESDFNSSGIGIDLSSPEHISDLRSPGTENSSGIENDLSPNRRDFFSNSEGNLQHDGFSGCQTSGDISYVINGERSSFASQCSIEPRDNLRKSSSITVTEELSDGWKRSASKRMSGVAVGKWDRFLITPLGTKLRSNTELQKYIEVTGIQVNKEVLNFRFVLWGMDVQNTRPEARQNCPRPREKSSKDLLLTYTFNSCSLDKFGKFPFKFPSKKEESVVGSVVTKRKRQAQQKACLPSAKPMESVSSNPIVINLPPVTETKKRQSKTKKLKIEPPNSYIAHPNSYIAPPNSYIASSNSYIANQNRTLLPAQFDHSVYSSKYLPAAAFQTLEIAPQNRHWRYEPNYDPTFNIFNNFSTFINDQNDSFNDTNFNHLPTINYAQASTSVSTSSTSKSSKKASTTKSNACSTISTPPTKKRPTAKKDQKAVKEKKSKACKRTAADKHSSSKAGGATSKRFPKESKIKTVPKPRKIRLPKQSNPDQVVSFQHFENYSQFNSPPTSLDCWLSDSSFPEEDICFEYTQEMRKVVVSADDVASSGLACSFCQSQDGVAQPVLDQVNYCLFCFGTHHQSCNILAKSLGSSHEPDIHPCGFTLTSL